MKQPETSSYGIEAVARALRLLEHVSEASENLDLTTLSRKASLPKSTTFRYLTTLEELGYIERDPDDNTYRLGLRLFQLGQVALNRLDIRAIARPSMESLARHYQETINLGMFSGRNVVLIEVADSPRSIRIGSTLGDRDPLHTSGLGKAILAYQAPEVVAHLAAKYGLPRLTEHTITDPQQFADELDAIRERGYSIDNEEGEIGLRCVAVPIFDQHLRVRYALSLAAPAVRMPLSQTHEIGIELLAYSRRLSIAVGATPASLPSFQTGRTSSLVAASSKPTHESPVD